jgi:transposase
MSKMKRFVQGDNRTQSFLLPEALDDYVTDTNPVRVVDVFVDELDLQKLGFEGVEPALTGRPSYHPEVMLKIYYKGFPIQHKSDGVPGVACCVACNV